MIEYKNYLERHKVDELKDIIRKYNLFSRVKINQKKKELIDDLLKHTELKKVIKERKDSKSITYIITIKEEFSKDDTILEKDTDKEHKKKINEEEKEIVKRIGRSRGMLDKLKEDKFKLEYDDPYYIDGREGNMPKKNKDEKALKEIKEEIKKYKDELKKALEDYKKFKL